MKILVRINFQYFESAWGNCNIKAQILQNREIPAKFFHSGSDFLPVRNPSANFCAGVGMDGAGMKLMVNQ